MSVLRIDDVVTLDCIRSRAPLEFGLSCKRAYGADGVLLWCVYAQFMPRGAAKSAPGRCIDLRELVATRMDGRVARGVERALKRELEQVSFVASASATLKLSAGGERVDISEEITLTDGRVLPLGFTIDEVGAALRRLGTL